MNHSNTIYKHKQPVQTDRNGLYILPPPQIWCEGNVYLSSLPLNYLDHNIRLVQTVGRQLVRRLCVRRQAHCSANRNRRRFCVVESSAALNPVRVCPYGGSMKQKRCRFHINSPAAYSQDLSPMKYYEFLLQQIRI